MYCTGTLKQVFLFIQEEEKNPWKLKFKKKKILKLFSFVHSHLNLHFLCLKSSMKKQMLYSKSSNVQYLKKEKLHKFYTFLVFSLYLSPLLKTFCILYVDHTFLG